MAYRDMKIASVVVVGVMAAGAAITLRQLPPGVQLPTHFNFSGEADRFANAGTALFGPVGIAALLSVVMAALPRLEPLRGRLAASATLYRVSWGGVLAIMAFVEAMVIATAFGGHIPNAAPLVAAGLVMVAIGNALPKSRPNFFLGIKTPWTLTDTDTWIATHRLGGRLSVIAGLFLILLALLPSSAELLMPGIIVAVALLLIPVPYSYLYWRRHHLSA